MIPLGAASRLTSLIICLKSSQLDLPFFECLTRIRRLGIINRDDAMEGYHEECSHFLGSGTWEGSPLALAGVAIVGRSALTLHAPAICRSFYACTGVAACHIIHPVR
jgi:hypothetical protein